MKVPSPMLFKALVMGIHVLQIICISLNSHCASNIYLLILFSKMFKIYLDIKYLSTYDGKTVMTYDSIFYELLQYI